MTGRTPLACLVILAALASVLIFGSASASAGYICTDSYNPCGAPAISVQVSGTQYGNAGQSGNYSYTVTNEGGYDVTNVSVGDSACDPVSADANDGVLNPGEAWTFECSTTLAGNAGDVIEHDVTATGDVSDYPSLTADTSMNTEITALSIVKDVDKAAADPGDTLNYTITVKNGGPSDITYAGYVDDGNCSEFSNSFSLAGGESATFNCSHDFAPWGAGGEDSDPYVNTACAYAGVYHDLVVGGQSAVTDVSTCDDASTALKQHLHVKKTVDKSTADPFDQLNYTVTVSDDAPKGGLSYEGSLNDDGCENLQNTNPQAAGNGAGFFLNPGDSVTYTCDHNFNPGPQDGGKYTNQACAYAYYGVLVDVVAEELPQVQACDSATTTLAQHKVSGRIFEDSNANGVQDAGEPGLPGVVVYADVNGNGKHDEGEPTSTSDGQGNYSLNIDLGTTTIREETPAGATCSFPSGCSYTVDLPKNSPPETPDVPSRAMSTRADDPTGKDFGDWRPATVSGTVVLDGNGNGTRDAGENGVANILVYADLNGNGNLDPGEPSVNSGADGSYAISGLKPGAYVIRHIVLQDGHTCTAPTAGCAYNLALASNQSVGGKDFLDAPPPGQLVLPTRIVAIPHGFARLSGKTGCIASKGFYARVRSQGALRLVFFVDGKVVKSVVLPANQKTYRYRVNVSKMKVGHHVLAVKVVFRTKSNTGSKTLRMTFQRCAAQLRAPAFTG